MKDTRRLLRKILDGINGVSQKTPDGLSWKTLDGIDGLSQKDNRNRLSWKTIRDRLSRKITITDKFIFIT
jgi:hypothetical protein